MRNRYSALYKMGKLSRPAQMGWSWKKILTLLNIAVFLYRQIRLLKKPFMNKDLYISGENYSLNQAWIEGGLQNSDEILSKYF